MSNCSDRTFHIIFRCILDTQIVTIVCFKGRPGFTALLLTCHELLTVINLVYGSHFKQLEVAI